ncbi:extracellular solute-binding protein [Haladaptatus caseinilyticus]|uniref:extracellular solute-binding protein n=1 Tax=Haladaptatus caseinilyticus TaxID=2993314 RepID=UPI00224A7A21|nr:extracellular solute-binding protein [Haladaptatus caseinilyticus]
MGSRDTICDDSPTSTVTRREFARRAGALGGIGAVGGYTSIDRARGGTTVQWASNSDFWELTETFQHALWEAGLDRNISLEIIPGPAETNEVQQQYTRWLSANLSEPDLLMTDSGWTLDFIIQRQLLNLTEHLPEELLRRIESTYFRTSLSTAEGPSGDLYAVPLYPDFPTILYRKDLVEEAGYDPDGEDWATDTIEWKRFSRVTRNVLDRNADVPYGFTFQGSQYEGLPCCDFNEFMTSWGGAYFGGRKYLFGPVGKRPVTVNSQPTVDSIRMIRTFLYGQDDESALDGYAGEIVPRAVLSWIEDTSLAPFLNGDAVMHRNWPYAILSAGADSAFGTDLGVMPIPYAVTAQQAKYPGTGGPTASLGGWHVAVNPNTNKLDETLQVLEAMTQESFQLTLLRNLGLLPPNRTLFDSSRAKQVPVMGRYLDSLRVAGENAIPRPVTIAWVQESEKIAQNVFSAYSGVLSPERAMSELESQIRLIENYNEL